MKQGVLRYIQYTCLINMLSIKKKKNKDSAGIDYFVVPRTFLTQKSTWMFYYSKETIILLCNCILHVFFVQEKKLKVKQCFLILYQH